MSIQQTSRWRSIAASVIHRVVQETGYSDLKALRKALRDAYPFGERKYHPYKIWLDEVRRQTGGRLSRPRPALLFTRRGGARKDSQQQDMLAPVVGGGESA